MSDHDASWKDLPLMREVGSLCPPPPAPEKPKKPASETKTKITDDEIPDAHMIPDAPAKLLDSELYRWPCWPCRVKFFAKLDKKSTASSEGPKSRLSGITDYDVKKFIIDAEVRLAKTKSGKLPGNKSKQYKRIIDIENLYPTTDTIRTTHEEIEEIFKMHSFGVKGEAEI